MLNKLLHISKSLLSKKEFLGVFLFWAIFPSFLLANDGENFSDKKENFLQTTVYISESSSVYGLENINNAKVIYEEDLRVDTKTVLKKSQNTKRRKTNLSIEKSKVEPTKQEPKKEEFHYSQNASDKIFLFQKINLTASVPSSSNFFKFLNSAVHFSIKKFRCKNKSILFSGDNFFISDRGSSVFKVRPPPVLSI